MMFSSWFTTGRDLIQKPRGSVRRSPKQMRSNRPACTPETGSALLAKLQSQSLKRDGRVLVQGMIKAPSPHPDRIASGLDLKARHDLLLSLRAGQRHYTNDVLQRKTMYLQHSHYTLRSAVNGKVIILQDTHD